MRELHHLFFHPRDRRLSQNGGGIIIIKARVLRTNNNAIRADGSPAATCAACNDGMGDGGACGTVPHSKFFTVPGLAKVLS